MPHKYAQNIKVKQRMTVHSLRNHNDWHISYQVVFKTTTSVGFPFLDTHGSPAPSLTSVSLQAWALADGPSVEGLHSASQPGPVTTDTQFHIPLLHSPVTNTPWPKQYGGTTGLFDLQFQVIVIHFWEVKARTQAVSYTAVTVKIRGERRMRPCSPIA